MKVVALEEATLTLPQVAKLAKSGTVILTRKGKPLAAVKDLSRSDWERIALANNPRFQELIEDSRRSYREHGGKNLEDFRRALGLNLKPKGRRRGKNIQR
ncbi:MAG: hypothetical protein HY040_07645 [Planctomycetes bacterium]|nr:hypothetical protein [Planctomycetota bacterium]